MVARATSDSVRCFLTEFWWPAVGGALAQGLQCIVRPATAEPVAEQRAATLPCALIRSLRRTQAAMVVRNRLAELVVSQAEIVWVKPENLASEGGVTSFARVLAGAVEAGGAEEEATVLGAEAAEAVW